MDTEKEIKKEPAGNGAGKKNGRVREIDKVAGNVSSWWSNTLVLVTKTKVKTWKGVLMVSFFSGLVIATVWGISSSYFQGSLAGGATSLFLDTGEQNMAEKTVQVGSTFGLDAVIDTDSEDVVAVKAIISYDKNSFELLANGIDTSGSIFAVNNSCQYLGRACEIVERDDANGKVTITLANPAPINVDAGEGGLVATLSFKALAETAPGANNFSFVFVSQGDYTDSDMIADDGNGTDTLDNVIGARVTVTAVPTFSCIGNTPLNSTLCSGDSDGLIANADKALVDTCGTPKCEYACAAGYVKNGNSCEAITYSCTGDAPTNASLCSGDETGLTVNTANSLVAACGTEKCEYTCSQGYEKQGDSCVAVANNVCSGSVPTNADLCAGDGTGLSVNTLRNLVSVCGSDKCEYICNQNYEKQGDSCVVVGGIPPSTCIIRYSDWSDCSELNDSDACSKNRTITLHSPDGCAIPEALTQDCVCEGDSDPDPVVVTDSDRPIKIEGDKKKFGKSGSFYADDKSVSFQGGNSDIANGKVKILEDGDVKKEISVGADGNWKGNYKVKKDGSYEFKIAYFDSNGVQVAQSSAQKVKVDTTDPKFTDLPLALTKKRGEKIWWKAKDDGKIDHFEVSFLGKKKKTEKYSFNIPADAPRGLHILKVRIFDKAGNTATRRVTIFVK